MPLHIYDEEGKVDAALLDQVYRGVLADEHVEDTFDVEISIVDPDTIQELNARTRGIDRVTDVLSFPTVEWKRPFQIQDYVDDVDPESGNVMLGDIVLCSARAQEQAEEFGHSYRRECGYLVLHGLLHLLGYDHEQEEDRTHMREAEERILAAIGLPRE